MKKFLLTLLCTLSVIPLFAQSFNYTYEGIELSYNIVDADAKTCSVAPMQSFGYCEDDLIIPDVAIDGNTEYSVIAIDNNAFMNARVQQSVKLGKNIKSIGEYAFYNCQLTTFTPSESLETIGEYAFLYSNLSGSLVLPSSLKVIGTQAFAGCQLTSVSIPGSVTEMPSAFISCISLTNIELGEGLEKISSYAFYSCRGLSSVSFPSSLTEIEESAFCLCTNLSSAELPENLTEVGNRAFADTGLTSINIPASLTSIGGGAFASPALQEISVDSGNKMFTSVSGVLYDKDMTKILLVPAKTKGGLVIPDNVKIIDDFAFFACTGLTSVTIGKSVTSIGEGAFQSCSSLTSISIPASVTNIGGLAFFGTNSLKEITVDSENPAYTSAEGVLYNKDQSILIICPMAKTGVYSIPSATEIISAYAFNSCSDLTSIEIGNNVKQIGGNAFQYCNGLSAIELPESVTEIGSNAFNACAALETVKIGNSLTTIPYYAFSECPMLKSVAFGNSVELINEYAFYNCSKLESIDLPYSLKTLGSSAFAYCENLKSVALHESLTTMGYSPFSSCPNIETVTYDAVNPVEFDAYTFSQEVYENATLYVPESAIEKCKLMNPWMLFENIKGKDFSGIEQIEAEIDTTLPYDIFNINGLHVGNDLDKIPSGIYIIRQGKTARKVVVK